jgi:hypothetical protein
MIDAATLGLSPVAGTYAVAVTSSIAVELSALVKETSSNGGNLPERYKKRAYPIFRTLFAFIVAGPLAVLIVDELSKSAFLAALYVGGSAPLIFDRIASGITKFGDKQSDLYLEKIGAETAYRSTP